MGDLMATFYAGKRVRTLNILFNQAHFEATRKRVDVLRVEYPRLLKPAPADPSKEKRRHKRQRSLRFAAVLLTDDLDFKSGNSTTDPSGGTLRSWLRWLTWLGGLDATAATLTLNGQPVTGNKPTPHDFISSTIAAALEDDFCDGITFEWKEDDVAMSVKITIPAAPSPTNPPNPTVPRLYRIEVDSKRSSHPDIVDVDPSKDDEFPPDP